MRSLIFVDCVREEYRHRLQHWLYAIHVPDSISKFGQYCNKYAFYNALPTPPEGERFGTRRMQLTEHYWMLNEITPEMSVNTFTERMPVEVLRWQGMIPDDDVDLSKVANMDGDEHRKSGGGDMPPFVFAHMPINWQDDYKGKGRTIADGPNYRWLFVLNFPDPEEGEKWFQEVFVPYFQNRPEVNRFVSSKIYPDVVGCKFQRAVEMWFDGPEEWYTAAVEGTRDMAKPEWAQQEQFPFLKSNYNIVGVFLTDMATSDNLTQYRGYIPMR
jgi:hypothetical protein